MVKAPETKDESTVYELGYLILPSVPEDKVSGIVASIKEAISQEGGQEIDSESPFKYPLAYEMSKNIGSSHYVISDAYLGWIKFEAEPARVLAIKAKVEKIAEIVRFLLIKATRQTTFTFAKARAVTLAKAEKEKEAKNASVDSNELEDVLLATSNEE